MDNRTHHSLLLLMKILGAATLLIIAVFFSSVKAIESADTLVEFTSARWHGDYSAMKKDKVVRVLIPYSITSYYLDNNRQKGITVEYMRAFEKTLNRGVKKEIDKVRIILIPTGRDQLIPGLIEGRGDIAAANITITPQRREMVDFSDPLLTGVREVVVTAKEAPDYRILNDLSGKEIHVRRSSSYFDSLIGLNKKLREKGLDPVIIVTVDERLEDEDLLELVHTGIVPAIVMDDHKTRLWHNFFNNVKIQEMIPVREDGEVAWAFRKESPELKEVINQFVANAKVGTKVGNILFKQYYSDINMMINPKTDAYQKKLNDLIYLFSKYGEKYAIDPLLLAALAFQESRFNQDAKSQAGAIGIMQLLPSTANDVHININNIIELEGNIEAGAKYLRFIADNYFNEKDIPELEKMLFVLASYNAGPNRVSRARKKAKDPYKWFENVEWEVARTAGAEPIKYVKNIYIYYVVFKNIREYDEEMSGR